jgi:hypothetical protein
MNIHPLWFVCLAVRISMIYAIWYLNKSSRYFKNKNITNKVITTVLLIIGLGFIRQGYFGSNNEVQVAKVFWHETRYVHGVIYLLSALYLLIGNLNMCLLLLGFDVVFSIMYRVVFNK